ncbi:MAG: head-tail adaptor protein [Sphingomonadaceae bacterium]|nr:head-tail adaptor protein [Sphingomonadaceae bacterium]
MTEFAGNLRERVVLETRLSDRDSRAGATGRYSYDGVAWAAVSPLMPADMASADALSAMPRWQVTIRKREGVGVRTRLTWRGKYLAVRALVSDPRAPAQMQLTCEEVR